MDPVRSAKAQPSVRIVLIGDSGVGKSTLVMSLVREEFVVSPPAVVDVITIPAEVTPQHVVTHIVDTSGAGEHATMVENEIKTANVVCIVYVVDDDVSVANVDKLWIPTIHRLRGPGQVPVILVGNKLDKRERTVAAAEAHRTWNLTVIKPLLAKYPDVETCIECSAKTLTNVSEVFYYSQKAVLHPFGPIYDRSSGLKPLCIRALKRVFLLCDTDKDDYLSDKELNEFQRQCFGAPLQQKELDGIKDLIRRDLPVGVHERGITEAGFLHLNLLFVREGRAETTWQILRTFGYDDTLNIRDDLLHPALRLDPHTSTELAAGGYLFLTDLFRTLDKDHDGALSPEDVEKLFKASPGVPWKGDYRASTVVNEKNFLTLQGFLSLWSMTALNNPRLALEYLVYLGYRDEVTKAIKVKRSRVGPQGDFLRQRTTRNVFCCYVFGGKGSGKSSFVRSLVEKPFEEKYEPSQAPLSAVREISVRGAERYLVVHEQNAGNLVDREVIRDHRHMDLCDVAAFVFDQSDPNSFAHVANLIDLLQDKTLPCLVIATKSDREAVKQDFPMTPEEFCAARKLPPVVEFSAMKAVKPYAEGTLFETLVVFGLAPHLHCPEANKVQGSSGLATAAKAVGVILLIGLVGYIGVRMYSRK